MLKHKNANTITLSALIIVGRTILLRSTDFGRSWNYYSTVASWFDLPEGRRGHGAKESGLVRLADGRLLAIFRTQSGKNLFQCWSDDDGRTWTKPVDSGVGSVEPALVRMSNGILVCSYGRPDYRLMLSIDGTGETWTHHTVIAPGGDGTTGIVEVAPNQLAYSYQSNGIIWVAFVEVKRATE